MLAFVLLSILSVGLCSDVLEFTGNDFDVRINEKELTLVKFYAPWCGHCQRLAPHYDTAAKALLKDAPNVALAKVDCTAHQSICSKFDVSGYPTLKLFRNGLFEEAYDGTRDSEGLIEYMLSKSKPSSYEITKSEQKDEIIKPDKPFILTFAKTPEDPLFSAHMQVSKAMSRKAVFAHTHDASMLKTPSSESVMELYRPKILHTKLEESSLRYSGDASEKSVKDWIIKNGHGLVGYRSRGGLIEPSDNYLVLYHNASITKYPKGVSYYRNRILKALQGLGNNLPSLTFTYSFSDEYAHELMDMGLEAPAVVIFAAGKKYVLKDYSPDKLAGFLKSYKEGTLEAFIKSEPIPSEQKGFAKKVVARNFDEFVNDPTKDVFIAFHAPWCGHCKKLMPDFEKLAEMLKDEPNLMLVTVDATANDVPPPYKVDSFPTIYFTPKNEKSNPSEFKGGRSVDEMLKFIAKTSTEELLKYDRNGVEKKVDL